MKKIILTSFLGLNVLLLLMHSSVAQEVDFEDLNQFAYGIVQQVAPDRITIAEFSLETNQDIEESYRINEQTQFRNIESYTDIAIGDEVDIDFTEVDSAKIALLISKDLSDGSEGEWSDVELSDTEGDMAEEVSEYEGDSAQ